MQNGEHSKGGEAGTAQSGPLGHATVAADERTGAGNGASPSGWLDRVALHNRAAASSEGALRPRLPYPFEAMSFATADAAPHLARPGALWPQPPETPPAATHAAFADGRIAPPVAEPVRPAVADRATAAPVKSEVTAAATPAPAHAAVARPHSAAPVIAARELLPPKSERAEPHADAPIPAMAPSPTVPPTLPARPTQPAQAMVAATAAPQSAAAPRNQTVATPVKARLPGHDAAHAPPRRMQPRTGGATLSQSGEPLSGRAQQAAVRAPSPALRGAAPPQTPLAARPPTETAPEITIDIHIGRIDVRAPVATAPASAAAPASAQRGGDALNAYLARRARGARS